MFVWRGKWRHRDASNPSILHLRCLWRPTRTDLWKTGPNNESKPSCHTVAHFQPSIFDAARHIIRCRIQDAPRCNHAVAVFTQRMTYDDISSLSTHDQVLMAQICGGHCHRLATYHNVVDSNHNCSAAPHTLEHWLQECPTTAAQRLHFLGTTDALHPGVGATRSDPVRTGNSPKTPVLHTVAAALG